MPQSPKKSSRPADERDASMVRPRKAPDQDGIPERRSSTVQPRRSSTPRELDRSSLLALKAGNLDPALINAFVTCYERPVYGIVSRMSLERSDVEAIVRETMQQAIAALPAFEPDGKARVSSWVVRIGINKAIDTLRKRKKEHKVRFVSLDASEPLSDPTTPEDIASGRDAVRAVARAVFELPIDEQLVFILVEYEGLSTDATAELLAFDKEAVKRKLSRAKARLRAMLGSREDT